MNQILSMAITVVLAALVSVSPASAQQKNDRIDDVIAQRLDMILKRLETIETRLKKLEDEMRGLDQWWVDDRGVLRANNGRPIGFWGIDGRPSTSVK